MTRHSFSGCSLDLTLPVSWNELDDGELRKVFRVLMLDGLTRPHSLVLILSALTGMRVISRESAGWMVAFSPWWPFTRKHLIRTWEVTAAIKKLEFLADEPRSVVRLSHIGKFAAKNAFLRGEPFGTYIACDNHYQQYLMTRDESHLKAMAVLLYRGEGTRRMKPDSVELYSVFYWWYSMKLYYSRRFPSLFVQTPGSVTMRSIEESMDAMVRTLTGGDVTKKEAIYAHDTYDALKELNEKAREAQEIKRRMKK